MFLSLTLSLISTINAATGAIGIYFIARGCAAIFTGIALAVIYRGSGQEVYNILWAIVFGFATLNIISLAAKRSEPGRRGFTFGELLAVMIVALSVFLLAVEMFNLFHIFPIKLRR